MASTSTNAPAITPSATLALNYLRDDLRILKCSANPHEALSVFLPVMAGLLGWHIRRLHAVIEQLEAAGLIRVRNRTRNGYLPVGQLVLELCDPE